MLLFILITFTLTRATSQKTSSDIILREESDVTEHD